MPCCVCWWGCACCASLVRAISSNALCAMSRSMVMASFFCAGSTGRMDRCTGFPHRICIGFARFVFMTWRFTCRGVFPGLSAVFVFLWGQTPLFPAGDYPSAEQDGWLAVATIWLPPLRTDQIQPALPIAILQKHEARIAGAFQTGYLTMRWDTIQYTEWLLQPVGLTLAFPPTRFLAASFAIMPGNARDATYFWQTEQARYVWRTHQRTTRFASMLTGYIREPWQGMLATGITYETAIQIDTFRRHPKTPGQLTYLIHQQQLIRTMRLPVFLGIARTQWAVGGGIVLPILIWRVNQEVRLITWKDQVLDTILSQHDTLRNTGLISTQWTGNFWVGWHPMHGALTMYLSVHPQWWMGRITWTWQGKNSKKHGAQPVWTAGLLIGSGQFSHLPDYARSFTWFGINFAKSWEKNNGIWSIHVRLLTGSNFQKNHPSIQWWNATAGLTFQLREQWFLRPKYE